MTSTATSYQRAPSASQADGGITAAPQPRLDPIDEDGERFNNGAEGVEPAVLQPVVQAAAPLLFFTCKGYEVASCRLVSGHVSQQELREVRLSLHRNQGHTGGTFFMTLVFGTLLCAQKNL